MNLVQINERLKNLPMQVIQQYANGMNPEVPPYLALGELQRRELSQKQMATAQGGMQGPQPSVKEQVEQKAGLMALQQMQQQQMAQQQAQPRGPMPAPAGVPQPEQQPEAMMARGGLAAIPVRGDMFEYAGGGIVAFSGEDERVGSMVPASEIARILKKPPQSRTSEENAALEMSGQKLQRREIPEDSAIRRVDRSLGEVGPNIREYLTEGASRLSDAELAARPAVGGAQNERILRAIGVGPSAPPSPVLATRAPAIPFEQASLRKMETGMIPAGLPGAAIDKGVEPPVVPSIKRNAGPRAEAPAAPQAGLAAAAAPTANPFIEEAAALAREKPVAPTAAGVIEEQKALLPAAMQEAAMQKRISDQRARAEQERAAYEKSRPSGLDELIRVFGQAGQYKGLSGMAPAYTALQQQKRAEDLAMEKRQNELLSAIEGKEYEGAKEIYGARAKTMDAKTAAFENRLTNNAKVLADLGGTTERSITEQLNRTNQMDMTKMRIAAERANALRPGAGEVLTSQFLAKKAQARELLAKGDTAGAARVESEANDILTISGKTPTSGNTDRIRGLQTIINSMDASPEEKADAIAQLRNLTKAPEVAKTPITKAEYDKLPKGATYTAPDGTQRTKG